MSAKLSSNCFIFVAPAPGNEKCLIYYTAKLTAVDSINTFGLSSNKIILKYPDNSSVDVYRKK